MRIGQTPDPVVALLSTIKYALTVTKKAAANEREILEKMSEGFLSATSSDEFRPDIESKMGFNKADSLVLSMATRFMLCNFFAKEAIGEAMAVIQEVGAEVPSTLINAHRSISSTLFDLESGVSHQENKDPIPASA